jgi:hypothetical protein
LYYEDMKASDAFIDTLGRFFEVPASRILECRERQRSIGDFALRCLHKTPISKDDVDFYKKRRRIELDVQHAALSQEVAETLERYWGKK